MQVVPDTIITRFDKIDDDALKNKGIEILVARLDLVHPVVSGNKLFKLHYFLTEAISSAHKTLITFGGAYSNHLAATAFAAHSIGIKAIGFVRGEMPQNMSHTLKFCLDHGMELHFLARQDYTIYQQAHFRNRLIEICGEGIIVPEGGYHPLGAKGASLIMAQLTESNPTHICTAVGTATTLAGLAMAALPHQRIIAVPVIKNMTDIKQRVAFLTGETGFDAIETLDQYHFGGYAKHTSALFDFMNDFYARHTIPLDMVYTAKMMFGILEQARNGKFKSGSKIICLHTGGLQGNLSLPPKTLIF